MLDITFSTKLSQIRFFCSKWDGNTLLSRLRFLQFLRSISILPVNSLSILDGKRVSQTFLEPLTNLFYLHKWMIDDEKRLWCLIFSVVYLSYSSFSRNLYSRTTMNILKSFLSFVLWVTKMLFHQYYFECACVRVRWWVRTYYSRL